MAKRIAVLEPHQAVGDDVRFFEKKSIVEGWIRRLEAIWIVKGRLVMKVEVKARIAGAARAERGVGFYDGPIGIGNVLPFSRSSNPLFAPDKLHYEIPRAGDRGLVARHRRRRIRVSSRNRFNVQLLPLANPSTQLYSAC